MSDDASSSHFEPVRGQLGFFEVDWQVIELRSATLAIRRDAEKA